MSVERILLKGGCVLTRSVLTLQRAQINEKRLAGETNLPAILTRDSSNVDLARVRRLAYESRDHVVSKAAFTMPAI